MLPKRLPPKFQHKVNWRLRNRRKETLTIDASQVIKYNTQWRNLDEKDL